MAVHLGKFGSLSLLDRHGPASRRWLIASLLFAAALILLAPTVIFGAGFSQNDIFNYVWTSQFSDQLLAGNPYPRWLTGSNDALGSPAFYYYPPISYYVAAAIEALTPGHLPPEYQVGFASLILLFASGISMFLWLGSQMNSRWALLGAIAYQIGPSHLIVHYVRGAFAEFAAFVFIPLVMLGLRRLARASPLDSVIIPLAYAGLLLSHAPLAVLVSTTLIPLYALYLLAFDLSSTQERLLFAARGLALGLLGLALAAVYLGPMTALQPFVDEARLWGAALQPKPWLLIHYLQWPFPGFMRRLALIMTGAAVLSAGVVYMLLRGRSRVVFTSDEAACWRETLFWAVAALFCYLLMSGIIPLYWEVDIVAKAQFPYRMMGPMEFASTTATVLFLSRHGVKRFLLPGLVGLVLVAAGLVPMALDTAHKERTWISPEGARIRKEWSSHLRDAEEFLPNGFFPPVRVTGEDRDPTNPIFTLNGKTRIKALRHQPLVRVIGPGTASATANADGSVDLLVSIAAPTQVVIRRFYFPSWTLTYADGRPASAAQAFGPDKLTAFLAPAGVSRFRATVTPLPIERMCSAISLNAALLIALIYGFARLRQPQPPGSSTAEGDTVDAHSAPPGAR